MNVSALTAVVEEALGRLRQSLPAPATDPQIPSDIRESMLEHELSKDIREVLEAQEEFAKPLMISSLTGSFGFHSQWVAPMLLREARRRTSAKTAVAWLEKVLGTNSGAGIAVATLWGLTPDQRLQILDDVDLLPFERLPSSRQKEALTSPQWPSASGLLTPMYAWQPPTAALVARVEITPYLLVSNAEPGSAGKSSAEHHARFEDIRLCLAASGPAATIPGPAWFQYLDPDLEAAVIGAGTHLRHQEVVPFHLPENTGFDPTRAAELVRAFVKLEPGLKNRVRTAMERLHQALVRRSPADGALEIAIALETLLVNSSGEHTFKIALRAALLTSVDPEERSNNRAIIEAAYVLRSALMHSGQASAECTVRGHGKSPAIQVVADAVRITSLVVRRIVSDGVLPDWNKLELSNSG